MNSNLPRMFLRKKKPRRVRRGQSVVRAVWTASEDSREQKVSQLRLRRSPLRCVVQTVGAAGCVTPLTKAPQTQG
jgi:hypothetical protein